MAGITGEKIWLDGELVDWQDANVHILTHTLHYGLGVFEGIRCYRTEDGRSAVFRLEEHVARLFDSAHINLMEVPHRPEELVEAVLACLRANRLEEGYIRPLVFIGEGEMGLNPGNNPVRTAVIVWPWGKYLGEEGLERGIRAKVSTFSRHFVNSKMTKGKTCGDYVNSILAKREALLDGYDEAIMLDTEGLVSEASGENIFVVKRGELVTPPLPTVLEGITRESVIAIARDEGLVVHERLLTRDELYVADELFLPSSEWRSPQPSVEPAGAAVAAVLERVEELSDQGMGDGRALGIGLEVALGDVGRVLRAVGQHVVPGRVARRAAASHLVVPFIGSLEGGVHVEDHSAVTEAQVVHAIADAESGASLGHTGTVRHGAELRLCCRSRSIPLFSIQKDRRTADSPSVAMQDVSSRFREYILLERRRDAEGLTPAELARWTLLKRFLSRRFSPEVSEEQTEERRSVRVPTKLAVAFRDREALRSSLMTNISRGGLFIATERPAEIGTVLELRIDISETGESIDISAEVVSLNVGPDFSKLERGMGLRFRATTEETQRKLDALYERKLKEASIESA
jgi:branched-chain amino acid aminotransferase